MADQTEHDDLRQRCAEALAAKFTEPIYYEDLPRRARGRMQVRFLGAGGLPSYRDVSCQEAAEVCAAVRDEELERLRGYAKRMEELVIEKDREASQWAGWLHEAEARFLETEKTLARVRDAHRVHRCADDGHMWGTPSPCGSDGVCACGRPDPCPTLAAIDGEQATP